MPGRCCSTAAGQPRGVRVLMPRPLSSQTSSTGQSRCTCVRYAAALSAPAAVEWLTEASPKLQTTTASSGHGVSRPEQLRQPEREAEPDRARQVRGDRRGLRDDVQPRVPEHLVPAARHRVRRRAGEAPQRLADRVDARRRGARGRRRTRRSGSAAAPGRWSARAARRRRSTRGRPSRSCRSRHPRCWSHRAAKSRCRLSAWASKSASSRPTSASSAAGAPRLGARSASTDAEEVLVDRLHGH